MKTAGLDPSTCTGMAVVGDGEDRGKTVTIPSMVGFQRLQLIADEIARTLEVWEPEFIAIEGYAFVRNLNSFVTLVEVGTVVRHVVYSLRIPWVNVPPMTLKKWTTGRGNATKDEMAVAVEQRWAFVSRSDDIVDAFALAQMAQLGEKIFAIKGVSRGWNA